MYKINKRKTRTLRWKWIQCYKCLKGDQGTQRKSGNYGGTTFSFIFDNSINLGDSGIGKFNFNNNIQKDSTEIYINYNDKNENLIENLWIWNIFMFINFMNLIITLL